mgnify:CR=1 FL=1
MKTVGILGSTGSIGTQTLEIIKQSNNKFNVDYLYADSDYKTLYNQIKIFSPNYVCINNKDSYEKLSQLLGYKHKTKIILGEDESLQIIGSRKVDLVLNGIVGINGLKPTIAAIKNNMDIALSNKESLVLAGEIVKKLVKKHNVNIFPVDSEHSAIWQCLRGEKNNDINKIILTASGGPFRELDKKKFSDITVKDALKHPNWEMGNKITIDSATMMNKGFEIIETYYLFDIDYNNIEVLVHPESIVHSMVEFNDRSIKAQLGYPDMKIPINYALNYPNHSNLEIDSLDLSKISQLTFEKPDLDKFKCIKLAYTSLEMGGTATAALNISNDFLVDLFLKGKINFIDIPRYIEHAIVNHPHLSNPSLEEIYNLMDWIKNFLIKEIKI